MKTELEVRNEIIEREIIKSFGRKHKYRMYTIYGNEMNGNSVYCYNIETRKGKITILYDLIEREMKMQKLLA